MPECSVEAPCVMELSEGSVVAIATPLILILVVCVALLVRSLK